MKRKAMGRQSDWLEELRTALETGWKTCDAIWPTRERLREQLEQIEDAARKLRQTDLTEADHDKLDLVMSFCQRRREMLNEMDLGAWHFHTRELFINAGRNLP